MQNQPLTIPITITTGYFESGDSRKDDHLRIDQTAYYLGSIFWAMNTAAKGFGILELETTHELFTFPEFRQNVEMLSEIGVALAERLTVYSLAIKDSENSEVQENV